MVTQSPLTLMGVRMSWKMNMLRKMTATSLKIPATELRKSRRSAPDSAVAGIEKSLQSDNGSALD